jgi:hypothetical protein
MSEHPPIQDTITLVLNDQKIVVHETVRVNVGISAQVAPETSEADFRKEIQDTLKRFINADWKIQSISRFKGNKYENVSVAATARIPETENYRLQERANEVTRIGFELVNPNVDYSLTFDEIQAVNAELRQTLLRKALDEVTEINQTFREMGTPGIRQIFRISNIRFDAGNNQFTNATPLHLNQMHQYLGGNAVAASATAPVGAYNIMETDAASADPGPSLDLNVSTRFSMVGTFTLSNLVSRYS